MGIEPTYSAWEADVLPLNYTRAAAILRDSTRVAKDWATRENGARERHFATSCMISVTINGERRELDRPLNCSELLARLDLTGKRVALERNGEIVPRGRFADERLAEGDRLEIVVAVGGG